MDNAPHPRPRPSIAWPAHLLGLLSVSFLGWSVLVPWMVPRATRGAGGPIPTPGLSTIPGQFVILALMACIVAGIALQRLRNDPPVCWVVIVGAIGLLLSTVLWGIAWNTDHDGHAIPGLLWGSILGMSALGLYRWTPTIGTTHDPLSQCHPSPQRRGLQSASPAGWIGQTPAHRPVAAPPAWPKKQKLRRRSRSSTSVPSPLPAGTTVAPAA